MQKIEGKAYLGLRILLNLKFVYLYNIFFVAFESSICEKFRGGRFG